ncbi:unnamed protein product [Rotaria sordida]|uniref:Uncharacterized protein n=1 Tax=Rotaria sordida TaxID=392033 RepID=A0A814SRL4_9BILA|nr:unnamed protein product [Rotaria sordida]
MSKHQKQQLYLIEYLVLNYYPSSLTNIDNIPMKKNISYEFNRSNINSLSKEIIEETPYLRSNILLYDISIYDN